MLDSINVTNEYLKTQSHLSFKLLGILELGMLSEIFYIFTVWNSSVMWGNSKYLSITCISVVLDWHFKSAYVAICQLIYRLNSK